jgi:hypothetical protein
MGPVALRRGAAPASRLVSLQGTLAVDEIAVKTAIRHIGTMGAAVTVDGRDISRHNAGRTL